jgi:imidazole glycerol phosphate synthase subunit HisF
VAARYRAGLDEQATSAMCSEVTLPVVSAGGRPGLTHFDNSESYEHKHGEGERSEQQN